ncbi:hypothetical protein H7E67_05470 [Clostridium gasigenes]|uniref:hypothetical protein n=1 Tax=Clostridium gasigenes TaxID=94869 RepID=UPI0016273D21|nr:hypothetical protein [Clostridium gasigenes]MBB6622867.1 hypothetical protein [Clostridium gasigenes]
MKRKTEFTVFFVIVFLLIALVILIFLGYKPMKKIIKNYNVESVYIETYRDKMPGNKEFKFDTIIKYKDGTTENLTDLDYKSSDENVITFNEGKIATKNKGTATISVTYLGKEAERSIEVVSDDEVLNDLSISHNVVFNWIFEEDTLKIWWSGAPDLRRYTITKKEDGEEEQIIVSREIGTEFSEKITDFNTNCEYTLYLISDFGISQKIKSINTKDINTSNNSNNIKNENNNKSNTDDKDKFKNTTDDVGYKMIEEASENNNLYPRYELRSGLVVVKLNADGAWDSLYVYKYIEDGKVKKLKYRIGSPIGTEYYLEFNFNGQVYKDAGIVKNDTTLKEFIIPQDMQQGDLIKYKIRGKLNNTEAEYIGIDYYSKDNFKDYEND